MSRRRRIAPILASIVVAVILLAVIGTGAYALVMMSPVAETGETESLEVKEGDTARLVAENLEKQGLIRDKLVFDLMCRYYKVDNSLKVGAYKISPTMDTKQIIDILLEGPKVEQITVVIPEGYSVDQIIVRLVENGLGSAEDYYQATDAFTKADFAFLEGIPDKSNETGNRLEGFLFPDTYQVDRDMTPKQILKVFLKGFEQRALTDDVDQKLAARNMSIYEWVTLASIVERETVKDDERPLVASVFVNRLKINMLLQSCATVQFVLKINRPVLTNKDIQIDSPYNTYRYEGLPIGPVACPGEKSLKAALDPADTKYLYFCAKPDQSQAFAETLQEHEKNVAKYVNN